MVRLTTTFKLGAARCVQAPLLLFRRLTGRTPEVTTRRGGIRWHLDLREGIDFSLYVAGRFELRTARALDRAAPAGGVVCDCGANIGAHALPLARAVGPDGRIFAFEPTAFAFAKLRANIALNPDLAPRIVAEQMMLTAEPDAALQDRVWASWPLDPALWEDVRHGGRSMTTEGARVGTLDDYLAAQDIARLDLIKLDVDGNEYEVLAGARASLARWRPVIVMELAPYVLDAERHALEPLLALLAGLGYGLFDEQGRRPIPNDIARLREMIPPRTCMNVSARPLPAANHGAIRAAVPAAAD